MNIYPLDPCPPQAMDALLAASPLLRLVGQIDPQQLELLLHNSQLLEFRRGEVVIEPGQIDSWLYYLLEGQLAVYAGEMYPSDKTRRRVNHIANGELFGDFAVLMDHVRSALIIADTQCLKSTVLRTDFSVFGELEDTSRITLPVKLVFYRAIVSNLYSKLERYSEQFSQHHYAYHHRKSTAIDGDHNSFEALVNLDALARDLARRLILWNQAFLLAGQQS